MSDMSAPPIIVCSICKEKLIMTDTIDSISCGHIFHHNCIQYWRKRSAECPVCRFQCDGSQRVFLDFDENAIWDAADYAAGNAIIRELQDKLQTCERNLKRAKDRLDGCEAKNLILEEKYTEAKENFKKLMEQNDRLYSQLKEKEREGKK
uniref:RING-type domain-containing protein n=1 Tax=Glossina palpalis gambiensis TaxID=67801 RepID=A0A1B0BDU3_9MUSC